MLISQDLYHQLPQIIPDALVVIDEQGQIVLTNTLAEKLFGYANKELIGQPVDILVAERFRTNHLDRCTGSSSGLRHRFQEEALELNGVHKDGSEFPIDISSTPIRTESGTLVISTIRDITARRRTVEALRLSHETPEQRLQKQTVELATNHRKLRTKIAERNRSEEDLQAIQASLKLAVHAANVGLWDWDLRTNQVYLSPEWKHQLGYEDHEITNSFKEWECRLHPDDHDRMLGTIQSYIEHPWPNYEVEFRLQHKDTSYRWILTHAALMEDVEGKPYRMLGSHIDITERKQSEQALRQSHETLEQQVQDRTANLATSNERLRSEIADRKQAEEALKKAKDKAEQADDAKSRFLAAVSHDLRQPLHTLSLLVSILKESVKVQEPVREVINNLQKTMTFMGDLLDTLLDISRLESDFSANVTDFPLSRLFNRLKIRFERQAMKKGLELRVIPSRAIIHSDEMLLERILQNLISNAIHYTSTGKVLLGCRRQRSSLRIEVWDTGPGIPEEQRPMIFEDFYQLNNPARDWHKGLGLGLAIVNRGARLLGHHVAVSSTEGKGSVFSIKIPFVKT